MRRPNYCSNCDHALAKFKCRDCFGKNAPCFFCLGCSVIHPKVKPHIGHNNLEAILEWKGRGGDGSGGVVAEMTVEEDDNRAGDPGDGDGVVGALNLAYEWMKGSASHSIATLLKLLHVDRASILQDKRQFILVAVTFLICYLLIKRLFGRHVSVVVAAGCMVGLRWFQKSSAKSVPAVALSQTLQNSVEALAQPGANDGKKSSLRSLSIAAAEAESLVGAEDEFWYNAAKNKKAQPKMRILVKDNNQKAMFNPSTDT